MPAAVSNLTSVPRLARPAALALIALMLTLALGLIGATARAACAAPAESCPGSGAAPCQYGAVQIIGQRAEGLLRFPEAVAVDTNGNVYVADQLSYVVQKFSAAGAFETEWGSYGGGHGPIRPDRRSRDRRSG